MVRVKDARTRNVVLEKTTDHRLVLQNILVVSVLFCLPLLRGILRPIWLSIPPIGEVNQWWPLPVVSIFFPLFAALLLWINARVFLRRDELDPDKLSFSIRLLSGLYIATVLFFAVRLFIIWFDNPVGKYLLWSPNSYYLVKVWEFALPYALHAGSGMVLYLFFYVLYRLTGGRVVEKNEALLGILVGLIFGPATSFLVVTVGFAVTVCWSLYKALAKNQNPTRLTPGIFIASYIILLIFQLAPAAR